MSWPDKNGISLKEHYMQAGMWHKIEMPEIPGAGSHIWEWYWELDSARKHSGSGPLPIGFGDIKDWMDLTGADPNPGEIKIIRRMDTEYLKFDAEQQKKRNK